MARGSKFDWTRIIAIALLVGVVGYVFGRPYLEDWLGSPLPSIFEEEREVLNGNEGTGKPANPASSSTSENQISRSGQPADERTSESGGRAPTKPTTTPWRLKELSGDRFQSPAGLIYGAGPQGEHRLEHVMRHAEDDPSRPTHGVFDGDRDKILQMLDEGFELVKQTSHRVSQTNAGARTEFTIKMNRSIGYVGGKAGKRDRFPKADKLRLILEDGNQVITAYPVR